MDSKTKWLLNAAEWVVEQSCDPETGGRDFEEAIINLKGCVDSFKKRKKGKEKIT
jgi:hypothetical protein